MAASALTQEQLDFIKKLEAPFHAKLSAVDVSETTMAALGKAGVRSIPMLTAVADDRKDLRQFLKDCCGMDPAANPMMPVEIGKLVIVFDACMTKVSVDAKVDAERAAAQLPPQVNLDEYHAAVELYKEKVGKITEAQTPSKPYFDLKFGQLTSQFAPERLTEITSLAQAENNTKTAGPSRSFQVDEANCGFRLSVKVFTVAMPHDSEVLRARLRTMGACHMLAKL